MNTTLKFTRIFSDTVFQTFQVSDYTLSPQERKSILLRRFTLGLLIFSLIMLILVAILTLTGNTGNTGNSPTLQKVIIVTIVFPAVLVLVLYLDAKGYSTAAAGSFVYVLVALIFIISPRRAADGTIMIYFVIPMLTSSFLLKPSSVYWTSIVIGVGVVSLFVYYSLTPKTLLFLVGLGTIAFAIWVVTRSYDQYAEYVFRRNRKLVALDELRSKFVSDVSHELRTPINNISAYSQLLAEGAPGISKEQIHDILERESEKLGEIVSSILDVSKMDSGLDPKLIETIDIVQVIEEIVEASSAQTQEKGLAMTVIAPDDPVYIEGDLDRIEKIYSNLISNAVTYTQEGQITIKCETTDGQVTISISDTGLGIKKDDLPFIFERFYRGKDVRHSTISGSGLGLAIVKENVDAHNGSVSIETKENKGTTFTVILPCSQGG